MSLQSRLGDLISAVGTDVKSINTTLASKITGSGTTKITVATSAPATGPDGEIFIQKP